MMKELDMLWDKKERFYAILKHCSLIGNAEACFIFGVVMVERTLVQLIYINNSNKNIYFTLYISIIYVGSNLYILINTNYIYDDPKYFNSETNIRECIT